MRPSKIRFIIILWLFFLFRWYGHHSGVQAQSDVQTVFITQVQSTAFPEIQVDFRPFDSHNNIVRNLTTADVLVYENETAVSTFQIDTHDRAPIFVIFVIDQGRYFDYGNIGEQVLRQSLTYLTDQNYFRDGYDTVAILTREMSNGNDDTTTWLAPTQSVSEFTNAVNRFQFATTGRTDGLAGVEAGLGLLSQLTTQGEASTAVIYLGSIIDDVNGQGAAALRAQNMAAVAHDQKVKLHVLHVETDEEFADPFITLARDAGGRYVRLDSERDNSLNLAQIYQDLVDQAQTYTVRYRSQSNLSGVRNVVVSPAGVPLNAVTDTAFPYSITVETPTVTLTLPDTAVNRRGARNPDTQTPDYGLDTVTIDVAITWNQNPPRQISSASLVVNNTTQTTIQPEVNNNRFQITWDVTGFQDETKTIPIQVRIQDELGIEAVSPALQVTVDATLPPPLPTPTPVATAVPTPDPCQENRFAPGCPTTNIVTLAVMAILGIAIVSLVILLIINRGRMSQVVQSTGEAIRQQVGNVQRTLVGGQRNKNQKVLARLAIQMARRELEGTEVEIYANTTRLGRNPKLCDIQLMNEEDISTISGQHCTIQYDPKQNTFYLTDDNSANGTRINGQSLRPNEPHILQSGDEIVLGELARRGAKLRFMAAAETAVPTPAFSPPADPQRNTYVGTANETVVDIPDQPPSSASTLRDLTPLPPRPKQDVDDSWLNDL